MKVLSPSPPLKMGTIGVDGYNKFSQDDWWIGVNDINEESKFVFDSDGSPIPFTPTWHDQNSNNEDCVLVFTVPKKWEIHTCLDNHQVGTLCEYGESRKGMLFLLIGIPNQNTTSKNH